MIIKSQAGVKTIPMSRRANGMRGEGLSKKRLRAQSLVIIVALLSITVFGTVSVSAENEGTIAVSSVNLETQGVVEVTVTISNNPGIAAFLLKLDFDEQKLLPLSIGKGKVLSKGSFVSNMHQGGDLSALEYVTAYWVNTSNVTSNGVLFTVYFQTINPFGSADFGLSSPTGIIDEGHNIVDPLIEVDSVQLGDEDFNAVISSNQLIKTEDAVEGDIEVTVFNNTAHSKTADLTVAIYDGGGRLVFIDTIREMSISEGTVTAEFGGICIANAKDEQYWVKAMVWEAGLAPLALPAFNRIGG